MLPWTHVRAGNLGIYCPGVDLPGGLLYVAGM
nr:MAG TPA: hypothetical protein [Bacteriophage sp.]